MVRSALVVWLALAPALARAQTVAHSIPAKQSPAPKACVKAWDPEFQKALPVVDQYYWNRKCAAGMTPKDILLEAKTNHPQALSGLGDSIILKTLKPVGAVLAVELAGASANKALAAGDPALLYGEKGADAGAVTAAPKTTQPTATPQASPAPGLVPLIAPPKAEPPAPGKAPCGQGYAGGPSWYSSIATRIDCMPGVPYRKALTAYLDMTGLQNYSGESVGGQNVGLDRFNQTLAKDPEFAKQVVEFYGRVAAREEEYEKAGGTFDKPGLDATAGAGKIKVVPAGWAWKDALAVAGNDPNRAMRLIGFCGHDDIMRTGLSRPRSDDEAGKLLAEKLASIDRENKEVQETLTKVAALLAAKKPDCLLCLINDPEELKKRLESLRTWRAEQTLADFKTDTYFSCPYGGSVFYRPRSLDEKADISGALKTRIAAAQKKKPEDIPAKYYHVLGAAAAACEMIRNGAPGWLAEMVQGKSAWVYRTLRMKQHASLYASQRKRVLEDYQLYLKVLKPGEARLDVEGYRDQLNREKAVPSGRIPFSHIDAFELMDLWGYGGTLFGKEVPPLDFRIGWLKGTFFKHKPEGWSEKRFTAAKSRMETFFVDWEWTTEQHEAGAEFARKVCKKEP